MNTNIQHFFLPYLTGKAIPASTVVLPSLGSFWIELFMSEHSAGVGERRIPSPNLLLNPRSCQSPECCSGRAVLSLIPSSVYKVKVEFPKQHWWFQFMGFGSPMIWIIPTPIRNINIVWLYINLVISACNENMFVPFMIWEYTALRGNKF